MITITRILIIFAIVVAILFFVCKLTGYENMDIVGEKNHIKSMPIYIINLKKRSEKKQKMIDELKKHDLYSDKVVFVEAMDGELINPEEFIKNKILNGDYTKYRKLRRGEIGCYISHLYCWQHMLENKHENAIILEDDITFDENFIENFNYIYDIIRNEKWDVLYLGRNCDKYTEFKNAGCNVGTFFSTDTRQIIFNPKTVGYGMYSYMVNRKSAEYMLKNSYPITQPIDNLLTEMNSNGKIKALVVKNNLTKVNTSISDTVDIK